MKKTSKGFTTVELVIVIAVIAILAAVLIPTFASLIKKANMSVDMQLVRNMNQFLAQDEITNGKPATVVAAKEILIENGADDFTPNDANNVFYWVGSENRVLLWEKNEENPEQGKVTYPDDLAKKYKGVTTASVDWADLADEYDAQMITPADGQTLSAALQTALSACGTDDTAYLMLPKNSTLNLTQNELIALSNALKADSGIGKHICLDLNGSTVSIPASEYGVDVPDSGSLELANGTWKFANTSWDDSAFQVGAGASLVLRNMKMELQAHTCIAPLDDASEVIIDSTVINSDAYFGVSTNGMTSRVVHILINDSTINNTVNGGGVGINVNATADVHINNSRVAGHAHALLIRAGHVAVNDSTLETITATAGIYKYDSFTHFYKKPKVNGAYVAGASETYTWSQANACPGAVLVAGDYAREAESYPGDVDVELSNVTFKTANEAEVPKCLVAAKLTKNVKLTYDGTTNIGTPIMYNYMIPEYYGSITINGVSKTLN